MTHPNDPPPLNELPPEASEEWLLFQQSHPELAADVERILFVPQVPELIGGLASSKFVLFESAAPDASLRRSQPTELPAHAVWLQDMELSANRQYDLALVGVRSALQQRSTPAQLLFVPDTTSPRAVGYLTRLKRLAQDTKTTVAIRTVDYESNQVFSDDFRFFAPPRATSPEAYWGEKPAPGPLVKPILHDTESAGFVELFRGNITSIQSWIQIIQHTPPMTEERLWRASAIRGLLSLDAPEATAHVSNMIVRLLGAHTMSQEYAYSVFGPLIGGLPMYLDGLCRRGDDPARQEFEIIKEHLATLLNQVVAGNRADLERQVIIYDMRYLIGNLLLDYADPDLQPLLEKHIRQLFTHEAAIITAPIFEEQYLKFRQLYGDLDDINQHITITP